MALALPLFSRLHVVKIAALTYRVVIEAPQAIPEP
jgi:hypothetical protein